MLTAIGVTISSITPAACALHVQRRVCIDRQRDARVRVPQDLRYHERRHAVIEHQTCRRMPQIMKADAFERQQPSAASRSPAVGPSSQMAYPSLRGRADHSLARSDRPLPLPQPGPSAPAARSVSSRPEGLPWSRSSSWVQPATLPTPGMSWICRFTEIVPRSQSMSAHLSPRSSESLIPVTIAR